MGAGHTVTVLYEVVPPGALNRIDAETRDRPVVDPLKYQAAAPVGARRRRSTGSKDRLLRRAADREGALQAAGGDVSELIEQPVQAGRARAESARSPPRPPSSACSCATGSRRSIAGRTSRGGSALLPVSTDTAADRQALADLVELAAGLRKLSGPSR